MQRAILRITGFCIDLFYRRTMLGRRVPEEGPILLVGNHPNGLIDPVLVSRTTDRPLRFLGKAPLFEMPGIGHLMRGANALPVYRSQDGDDTNQNDETFAAVFKALQAGDAICLFPEGKSHTEPSVQRLKTGAARMALGAEARAAFDLGVRVVPVGLLYRANRRFRSRVAVWVGEPIDVREFREHYASDERDAVRALTERIAEGLAGVSLGLDRWEDLPLLEWAERIDDSASASRDKDSRYLRLRALAAGVRTLRAHEPERIDSLARRIACFRERLGRLGASVDHLDLVYAPGRIARFASRGLLVLILGLPLALAGALVWALPYAFVPWLTRRLRPTRDVHATYQIVTGMVLLPLWALSLTALIYALSTATFAALFFLALAPLGLCTLAFLEWREEAMRDIAVFLRLGTSARTKALFAAERDEIAEEINSLRTELEGLR